MTDEAPPLTAIDKLVRDTHHHTARYLEIIGEPPQDRRKLLEATAALRVVLHRISDTVAEDWVAPNPRASERHAMAQYPGGLGEFVFATLQSIERSG